MSMTQRAKSRENYSAVLQRKLVIKLLAISTFYVRFSNCLTYIAVQYDYHIYIIYIYNLYARQIVFLKFSGLDRAFPVLGGSCNVK